MASVFIDQFEPGVQRLPLTLVPPVGLLIARHEQQRRPPTLSDLQYRAPDDQITDAPVLLSGVFVAGRNTVLLSTCPIFRQFNLGELRVLDLLGVKETCIRSSPRIVPAPFANLGQDGIDCTS